MTIEFKVFVRKRYYNLVLKLTLCIKCTNQNVINIQNLLQIKGIITKKLLTSTLKIWYTSICLTIVLNVGWYDDF